MTARDTLAALEQRRADWRARLATLVDATSADLTDDEVDALVPEAVAAVCEGTDLLVAAILALGEAMLDGANTVAAATWAPGKPIPSTRCEAAIVQRDGEPLDFPLACQLPAGHPGPCAAP